MIISGRIARVCVPVLVTVWSTSTLADPPAHAPAHGWREKHEARYVGHSGRQWEYDFEISSGHCNRQAIATVVGGVVGGALASQIAEENRAVATLIGAAAGALVGNRIGHKLDEADRSCVGHALELGEAGRPVTWTNESTGVRYELSPGADRTRHGTTCREYTIVAVDGRQKASQRGLACESQAGAWELVE